MENTGEKKIEAEETVVTDVPSEVIENTQEEAAEENEVKEEKVTVEKTPKKVAAKEVSPAEEEGEKKVSTKKAKEAPEGEEFGVKGIKTNFSDKLGTSTLARTMYGALCKNSRRLNRRLKTHITGRIQLVVSGGRENYVLDWRGEDLLLNDGKDPEAECVIEIGERDLLDVIKGNTNLQIALLSDKVKLNGQVGMALYLSNLFG